MISRGKCAPFTIPYEPVVKRCIPKVASQALNYTFQAASGLSQVVVVSDITIYNIWIEDLNKRCLGYDAEMGTVNSLHPSA